MARFNPFYPRWGIQTFPLDLFRGHVPPDIPPPGQFPTLFYMVQDIPPYHYHHAPIYIK